MWDGGPFYLAKWVMCIRALQCPFIHDWKLDTHFQGRFSLYPEVEQTYIAKGEKIETNSLYPLPPPHSLYFQRILYRKNAAFGNLVSTHGIKSQFSFLNAFLLLFIPGFCNLSNEENWRKHQHYIVLWITLYSISEANGIVVGYSSEGKSGKWFSIL